MNGEETGGRGRRRSVIDDVAAEVRAARREVADTAAVARESAGLLAEALPRLDEVERTVAALRGTITPLASNNADETAEDDEAAVALGLGDEPPGPWCWPLFGPDDARVAWDQLARWVGEVLCREYRLTRRELPDCWPAHERAVLELSWLRLAYRTAHLPAAGAHQAAEWHVRWLPAALASVAAAIDTQGGCAPGGHRVDERTREQHRTGTAAVKPSGRGARGPRWLPESGTGAKAREECSRPDLWLPYLRDVSAEDIALRRDGERSTAGGPE